MRERPWTLKRWLSLSLHWLAVCMTWSALLSITIPRLVDRFAPSDIRGTCLGLILALGGFTGATVQIVTGYRSDQSSHPSGRRRPYILRGTLLACGALVGLGLAPNPWAMLAAFLGIQVFLNLAQGPYQALLPDLVESHLHGLASMWMGLFQHLGQACGPLLAGWLLVTPEGLKPLCLILAGCLLVTLTVTMKGVQEPPGEGRQDLHTGWLAPFRINLAPYPDFTVLLGSRLLINMGFYTALAFLLYYVRYSLGAANPEGCTGQLMALMVVFGVIGGLPAGPLADQYSKVRLLYATNLTVGLGALLFIASHSLAQARAAGALMGLGFGAFMVIDWALLCSLMPPGAAQYLGIWNLASGIPQMLAPAVAGTATDLLSAHFGPALAYRAALMLVFLYLAAGTALLTRMRDPG